MPLSPAKQLRGICNVASPKGRAFPYHVVSKPWSDSHELSEAFIGQEVDYVANKLVHHGLEKLVDIHAFKGIFSPF